MSTRSSLDSAKKLKNPLSDALIEEWHPTKNIGLNVNTISSGSNRKVWWLGKECGHEWQSMVANRSYGRGCSYCSGKFVLPGFNDLLTLKPLVASQFHPTKNGDIKVEDLIVGSNKKVWWLNADCGHEWQMKVAIRNDHIPCSICDGFITLPGFNDVATTHPDLMKYIHPTKNGDLDFSFLSHGSATKIWWLGDCGHTWNSRIWYMLKDSTCVYCSNRRILKGFNDFVTVNPILTSEWHPTKNLPLDPGNLSPSSRKKVWWKCSSDHEWVTTVHSRHTGGHQCPYCTGRNTIVGTNDIATLNPTLASEWHPTKNGVLTPDEVKGRSSKKVWWQCHKGHEWEAMITGRTGGQGCPNCAAHRFVSKAEQEIADFITSQGIKIIQSNRRILKGMEIDIYVPHKNVAIEYNGLYWHGDLKVSDNKYHYKKWLAAKEAGIQLIQIWEDEWRLNPEQVKKMLLHKLGMSKQEKVFARKTTVVELKKNEVLPFLNKHHIQGFASASYYLGLEDMDANLVSVIGLKKEANNGLNIIRYATSVNVIGGFTKLLAYAEKNLAVNKFITFSDNCVSDGGLYANNGFTADKELAPDYKYVVKLQRKHKFGYRLKKFKDDPNLKFEENMTERELAQLNGIPRIWDAGKTRWVKVVNSR